MVGFLLLMHRGVDTAQLRYFLVRPEYRGLGLGKLLMELFMQFLRQCGYRSAYLWTVDELPAAASLYKRHGFTLTDEKPSAPFFGKPLREQRYDLVVTSEPGQEEERTDDGSSQCAGYRGHDRPFASPARVDRRGRARRAAGLRGTTCACPSA